jgi:ABC-type lipoprotein export system ATPase subunit
MDDGGRLAVRELTRSYSGPAGERWPVLTGVNLLVEPGETIALAGPSGSGKSTLLHLLGALDRPDGGTIHLGDLNVSALTGEALSAYRAQRVGFVFQDHHLLPQLTALENILLPALALQSATPPEAKERALSLLQQVGLTDQAGSFPARLSGGERQRVAVARALINQPQLLLCDEPTGNLDQQRGTEVVDLLLELAAASRVTIVMVTHNLAQARRLSRLMELRAGKLIPADT